MKCKGRYEKVSRLREKVKGEHVHYRNIWGTLTPILAVTTPKCCCKPK